MANKKAEWYDKHQAEMQARVDKDVDDLRSQIDAMTDAQARAVLLLFLQEWDRYSGDNCIEECRDGIFADLDKCITKVIDS